MLEIVLAQSWEAGMRASAAHTASWNPEGSAAAILLYEAVRQRAGAER